MGIVSELGAAARVKRPSILGRQEKDYLSLII